MASYPEDAPQTDDSKELKAYICKLHSELETERKQSIALQREVKEMKERTAKAV